MFVSCDKTLGGKIGCQKFNSLPLSPLGLIGLHFSLSLSPPQLFRLHSVCHKFPFSVLRKHKTRYFGGRKPDNPSAGKWALRSISRNYVRCGNIKVSNKTGLIKKISTGWIMGFQPRLAHVYIHILSAHVNILNQF